MMILVLTFLAFTIVPSNVGATVRYVGGSGSGNYTTIQAAIDAANPGDTVFVYSGNYSESLLVNKTISLVGENRNTTLIEGNGGGSTMVITADWVNITGFSVTRGNLSVGNVAIDVRQADNNTISHNIVSDSYIGVNLGAFMQDSFDNTLTDNILSGNFLGVYGYYTHWPRLVNNTIAGSSRFGVWMDDSSDGLIANNSISTGGIYIMDSPRMTLTENVMWDGGVAISGYALEHWNTHAIDTTNTVGGRPVYYWKNRIGGTVPQNAGLVILANSVGVVVENQNISHVSDAIALGFSSGNRIAHNIVSRSFSGIHLSFSDGNTITNNEALLNLDGIRLSGDPARECGTNIVTNNTALGNDAGILLYYARRNTISYNAISENGEGITFVDSWDHTVANNTISSNAVGIKMMGWSAAKVFANKIADNGNGVVIELYTPGYTSTIYHNEFINNTAQAYDDSSDVWDDGYPSGGNFWSDYTGVDNLSGPNQDQPGGDGIGDTPYPIPGGSNRDRYPLMRKGGPSPPLQPRNLNAVAGDSQVVLTWVSPLSDGGSPITNYTVYRGVTSGGETLLKELGDVLNYTDTGLANGQTYYYQVSAKNAIGEGQRSNEANATPVNLPGPPTGLTAVAGDELVALNWTAPLDDGGSPITNYEIYRGDFSGGETFFVEIGNELSYMDTGLTNGQTYYYQVSAQNAVGEGSRSNEANATPVGPPAPPTGLRATPLDKQVALTWSQPADTGGLPVLHYRIFRGTSPSAESFIMEIGNTLAYDDTGLANGLAFYYVVRAVNAVGEGPPSNEANATPGAVPSQPLGLRALASKGKVVLSWQHPADDGGFLVTGYNVYRGNAPGTETHLVSVGEVLTYTDSAVANGNTFYYWVTALNALGEGQRSEEANGTPVDISPGCVISTPRLGSTISGSVVISGLASDSDGFVQWVEVRIDEEDWTTASGNTSWSLVWNTTEVPDGEHTVFARSYDGNRYSPETSINVTVSNRVEGDTGALPFVALGLGVGGGAATVIWMLEPLRVALIGFLALLGTKLRRDEVFENEKRDMIRGYLAANPGANYASVRADLKIANGTLVYHLNTMEKEGFIRSWHDGRFKRFALKGHPIADIQPKLTDIELIVLQTLQNNPGMTQEAIAKEVGVSQPTISYHMKKLSELGFIKTTRHGMRSHYAAVIEYSRERREAAPGESEGVEDNEGGGAGVNGDST